MDLPEYAHNEMLKGNLTCPFCMTPIRPVDIQGFGFAQQTPSELFVADKGIVVGLVLAKCQLCKRSLIKECSHLSSTAFCRQLMDYVQSGLRWFGLRPSILPRTPLSPITDQEVEEGRRILKKTSFLVKSKSWGQFLRRLGETKRQ